MTRDHFPTAAMERLLLDWWGEPLHIKVKGTYEKPDEIRLIITSQKKKNNNDGKTNEFHP